MKQIHAYDPDNTMGTRPITMCGMVGKANTRNPSQITCGRCLKSIEKRIKEDRI